MSKIEDSEYEKLTQAVYQLILNKQGFKTVKVMHDITLQGKSGVKHQIDVYWELIVTDVILRVAIECKNYSSKITLGRIRDFQSVLDDVGNVQGIMVTKVGYQKGVKRFADHKGIKLKLLRHPMAKDWDGRLKKIVFEPTMVIPKILKFIPTFDQDWVNKNIPEKHRNQRFKFGGMINELSVVDKSGSSIKTFMELRSEFPYGTKSQTGLTHSIEFDEAYLDLGEAGLVKLKSLLFHYDVILEKISPLIIDAEDLVEQILKDALSGEIKFIHKDGSITG